MKSKKFALLSVTDKTGLVPFATMLHQHAYTLLSTGGTASLLKQHGLPVVEVADYTGFPEMMDGRIKTLHPKIHGGLLARKGKDEPILAQHDIATIDLLVVNLYAFEKTVSLPNTTLSEAIEHIDIGGPTMIRAGAKNYERVSVVIDPNDYALITQELEQNGEVQRSTRFTLMQKAFAHTAAYDATISHYLNRINTASEQKSFPNVLNTDYFKKTDLRYGENPHQHAALYTKPTQCQGTLAQAEHVQGKPLSYNNLADSDAAWQCVNQFDTPACVIVKHANPCGVALGTDLLEAYQNAYRTDPTSSFGGIIAFNAPLTGPVISAILEQQFAEVILAPGVDSPDVLVQLKTKPKLRLLLCGTFSAPPAYEYKVIHGGLLVQDSDLSDSNASELKIVTRQKPTDSAYKDLMFAWKVAKYVKSNAIVYAKNQATLGIGAGQMSRVDSAHIALLKAEKQHLSVNGAVMASDAFFPFRDSVDAAAQAGICAIIQPGGSIRDEAVIKAADEAGIAMIFTGIRHFRH